MSVWINFNSRNENATTLRNRIVLFDVAVVVVGCYLLLLLLLLSLLLVVVAVVVVDAKPATMPGPRPLIRSL